MRAEFRSDLSRVEEDDRASDGEKDQDQQLVNVSLDGTERVIRSRDDEERNDED